MRVTLPVQSRMVKRMLPRTLLGRSLLIMLVPMVLVLAVALQIFYGSHLNVVSRRFAAAVAGELAMTIAVMDRLPHADDRAWLLRQTQVQLGLTLQLRPGAKLAQA
jgi:two-component system osmolarity sensor histidine kinase EnvZ